MKIKTLITTIACFGVLLASGVALSSTSNNTKIAKATDYTSTLDFTTTTQCTVAETSELTYSDNIFTVSATAGSSSNANNYYPGASQSSTRVYSGATVTLSLAEGYYFASQDAIVISCNTVNYATTLGTKSTWTGATASVSSSTITVTPSDVNLSTISVSLSGTSGFTKIVANYTDETSSVVELTSISVDDITLNPGQTATASVTYTPTDATYKTVSYTSSNTGVATVDDSGVVTAVAAGTATLTVTSTVDDSVFATSTITVEDYAASALTVGDQYLIIADSTTYLYELTGVSASLGVATAYTSGSLSYDYPVVVEEGYYTNTVALKLGDVYLSYTVGSTSAALNSTSDISAASSWVVSYDEDSGYVASPVGNLDRNLRFNYNNGNPRFACYASTSSQYTAISFVDISDTELTDFTIDEFLDLYVGETESINVTYIPVAASDKTLTWESSDTDVAIVDDGAVTGVATGTATITASKEISGSTVSRTCTVTVHTAASTVTDTLNSTDLNLGASSYGNFSYTGENGAVYVGNAKKSSSTYNNSIQIRSSDSSGIITTFSGGREVQSITITFDSNNGNENDLYIYGSNTAYTGSDAAELYDSSTCGTLVTSIAGSTSSETYTFTEAYRYIGIRSSSNAFYIDSIDIVWELYTAETVSSDIKTLAGGWSNYVSTSNCASNYQEAKSMILTLDETELSTFQTSTDNEEIVSARTTYEYWCAVNGDDSPYSGSIVSSTSNELEISGDGSELIAVVAVVATTSLLGACLYLVCKKKVLISK